MKIKVRKQLNIVGDIEMSCHKTKDTRCVLTCQSLDILEPTTSNIKVLYMYLYYQINFTYVTYSFLPVVSTGGLMYKYIILHICAKRTIKYHYVFRDNYHIGGGPGLR